VLLNLPGSPDYNPFLPWSSLHTKSDQLAGTTKRYVNDIRSVGHSENHCWAVTHRVASYFSYLGLQIALRKMRPPTPLPGPWAGTIAFNCPAGVGVTCPEAKWIKAKALRADLQAELQAGSLLQRKPLESMRGFFIHLMRTYPIITPYLKGMHLTLDGWRPNRDEELWKLPPGTWDDMPCGDPSANPPAELTPAPRLTYVLLRHLQLELLDVRDTW
jgi:hypothetical protein